MGGSARVLPWSAARSCPGLLVLYTGAPLACCTSLPSTAPHPTAPALLISISSAPGLSSPARRAAAMVSASATFCSSAFSAAAARCSAALSRSVTGFSAASTR
jgi:hypothetical protein